MAYSTGIDRATGKLLVDWPHVVQSLGVIFTTHFGTRVMRRYFGSNLPRLLGENLVPETVLRFYSAFAVALLQEPRVALISITPEMTTDQARGGIGAFLIEFQYRPRGHLGDFTPGGARKVRITAASGSQLRVEPA